MDNSVRKSLRFPPDDGTVAWIDLVVHEDKKDFNPTIPALVIDEALDGCGVVTLFHTRLSEESECLVRVGNLEPLRAQVRWIKDLDDDVFKIGLMYLE
jgi:hypothetical protein